MLSRRTSRLTRRHMWGPCCSWGFIFMVGLPVAGWRVSPESAVSRIFISACTSVLQQGQFGVGTVRSYSALPPDPRLYTDGPCRGAAGPRRIDLSGRRRAVL